MVDMKVNFKVIILHKDVHAMLIQSFTYRPTNLKTESTVALNGCDVTYGTEVLGSGCLTAQPYVFVSGFAVG
jgi:hypothetical protein